jgi:hypothetical protein
MKAVVGLSMLLALMAAFSLEVPAHETAGQKDETRIVAINSGYSTFTQTGVTLLKADFTVEGKKKEYETAYGRSVDHILTRCRSGASDILLVTGDDLAEAVAMADVILAGGNADLRRGKRDPRKGKCWLVTYFGCGNVNGTSWKVEKIESTKMLFRLSYSRGKQKAEASMPYVFWVPLGEILAGTYETQLFDAESKSVSFSRRQTVR